ncbi:Putative Expressed protein [Rhizopus microsporus]|nr:Putative Expressed protein [Rhizopus microsporus]
MTMTSFCHNFSQLAACRFLLGFFEGVSYPCVYILLNTLYRRSEQSFCWGFIGIGTGMGTVIGVVIAYGIAHMEGVAGMHAWRWLLHLSEIELEIVEERTRDNCVVRNTTIKKEQIWEALREPRLYLLFFANMLICLENGGLVTYSTLLVEGLGFSKFTSVILQIPNGVAAAVFAMGAVVIAKWRQQNIITAIVMSLTSMIGCILIIVIPGTAKLVGFYLTWAMTGVMALLQTIVSNNVSGYTKRVFYNGVKWHPIRACFRYVTQKPWNRFPLKTKTVVMNQIISCLAGGRNKMMAARAYDFYNSEIVDTGLAIRTPETINNVTRGEIPLWIRSMGGHAVLKVPYSNAGQGVYTITNKKELDNFLSQDHHYDKVCLFYFMCMFLLTFS